MTVVDDIALIKRQEQSLILSAFDEHVAFALGNMVRERAISDGLALVVDVRTWDRQMFFAATPGTGADNAEWVRRKINTVRRFQRASYRMVLERSDGFFPAQSGVDNADFAIAGGGFPLRVASAGIIGCLTISGLPGRKDHGVVVDALCTHLGLDPAEYALGDE